MTTRKRKGVFGPEDRKKNMVIFIDEVNMPQKEKYAAQPPIELLRQWMDYGGWYDLETKEFKSLVDMVFVGAMGPPSAGRNSVTPRYMRHFFIQYVEPFSSFSLKSIFSNVLEWYFLNLKDPSKGIISLRDNIVNSTIELYNKIKVSKELLPTPAKSHYIYNLRDISKVFQGMTKATVKSFTDDVDFIKLWAHECLRVFQDRLISNEDRDFLLGLVKDMVRLNFRREWNSLVQVEPLLWASFVPTIYPDGDRSKRPLSNIYCELTDRDSMKKAADSSLEEYNNYSSSKMNLVLFTTAIEHVIKIVRVISTPFGHALLVGVGGSGRRSLATLAISIAGFDLFQIEIHKSYDQKAWAEDL
jgi:dynein heavy chain